MEYIQTWHEIGERESLGDILSVRELYLKHEIRASVAGNYLTIIPYDGRS